MSVLKNTRFQFAEPKRKRDEENKNEVEIVGSKSRDQILREQAARNGIIDLISPPASPRPVSPPPKPASPPPKPASPPPRPVSPPPRPVSPPPRPVSPPPKPASPSPSCKDERTCRTCKTRPINIIFKPCNHACTCSQCADQKKCPICKEAIQRRVKIGQQGNCAVYNSSSSSDDSSSDEDGITYDSDCNARCNVCGFSWDGNAQHICDPPTRWINVKQTDLDFDIERVSSDINEIVEGEITKESDGSYSIEFEASDRKLKKLQIQLKKIHIDLEKVDDDEFNAIPSQFYTSK